MVIRVLAIVILLIFAYIETQKFIKKKELELSHENLRTELSLKTGDIIVKKEQNPQSLFLSQIDDSNYSDIGVILEINGKFYVANFDLSEDDEFLKITPFKSYVYFASNLALFRYEKDIDKDKLFSYLQKIKDKKTAYDYTWSLNSNEFYGAKFINSLFFELFEENLYSKTFDFYGLDIISIRNILENINLKKQFELDFQELE